MSKEYESIMRGLKEAVKDARENNRLLRKTVDSNEQVNRNKYKRLDLSKLEYGNTIVVKKLLKTLSRSTGIYLIIRKEINNK